MMIEIKSKHTMLTLCILLSTLCVTSEARLSRDIPELDLSQWSKLDLEFGSKVSHIHHGVANGDIDTSKAYLSTQRV